jgi:hypothetical protein
MICCDFPVSATPNPSNVSLDPLHPPDRQRRETVESVTGPFLECKNPNQQDSDFEVVESRSGEGSRAVCSPRSGSVALDWRKKEEGKKRRRPLQRLFRPVSAAPVGRGRDSQVSTSRVGPGGGGLKDRLEEEEEEE